MHNYTDEETAKSAVSDDTSTIFQFDENDYVPFNKLDEMLSRKVSAAEKLEELSKFIQNHGKNRFAYKR